MNSDKAYQNMLSFNKKTNQISPITQVMIIIEKLVHIICEHKLFKNNNIDGINNILLASYMLENRNIDVINIVSNDNDSLFNKENFEFSYRKTIEYLYKNTDFSVIDSVSYLLKICNNYGIIITKFKYLILAEQIFQYVFEIESIINRCIEYNPNNEYNPFLACYGINLTHSHIKTKKIKLAYHLSVDLFHYIVNNKSFLCQEAFSVYNCLVDTFYCSKDYNSLIKYLYKNYDLLKNKIGFENITLYTLFNIFKCNILLKNEDKVIHLYNREILLIKKEIGENHPLTLKIIKKFNEIIKMNNILIVS